MLVVIVGKLHSPDTFIAGAMVGLGGPIVFSSWITLTFLYLNLNFYSIDRYIIPLLVGLGFNIILNFTNAILVNRNILPDPEF